MKEFVDFLGGQSPYDTLDREELDRLARRVEVEYFTRGSLIVRAGEDPLDHVWVVRTGEVEVLDGDRLVDLLDEGDTFGHVSLLGGAPPSLSVRAGQDTLCYRLADPREVLDHPDRLRFAPYGSHLAGRGGSPGVVAADRGATPVGRYLRPIVRCEPEATVREVAEAIGAGSTSCAIVDFPDGPGIVTDADFRRFVAAGTGALDAPVRLIANRPARSVDVDVLTSQAFAEMVEHGVHHLLVTDGGRPAGVLRVVDLASAELRDPLVVRASIDAAASLEELAAACATLPRTAVDLFDAGVPPTRVGALLAAVLDAVLKRLLDLDPAMDGVGAECSWIVLGSLARREVLPASDVDTALVWTAAEPDAGVDADELASRVLAGAHQVLESLVRVGLEKCADGANADNPRFARSLEAWTSATDRWLHDPNSTEDAFLLSTMLADSRPVTGTALGRRMTDGLLRAGRSPQFLRLLLQYTLSTRPPTGFVRDFVVEHSGEHRGQLNLKRGGLRPVSSIGRWVAVVTGDARGTTPDRLLRGVEAGLLTRDEADTLVGAHEQVFGLLLEQEVEAIRAGRPVDTYVAPDALDSLSRRHLRESFRAIAHVQGRLESIWTNRAGA